MKRFFTAPDHSDPERARVSALLMRVLGLVLISLSVITALTFWLKWIRPEQRIVVAIQIVMLAALTVLVRRGRERLAGWLFCLTMLLGTSLGFLADADDAFYLAGFTVTIVVSGLVLTTRGAVAMSTLTVAVLGVGGSAHSLGYLDLPRASEDLGTVAVQLVVLAFLGTLMVWSNRGVVRMIGDLGRQRDMLERGNQALRRSEARYQVLFDQSPGGVLVFGETHQLEFYNAVAGRLLDLPSPPDGKPDAGDLPLPGLRELLSDAGRGEVPERTFYLETSEEPRRLSVRVRPILLLDNRPGQQVILQDHAELEAAERKQVALEHQLAQSLRMESLGRLAGGVAHDFNNLLSVTLGNCELLLLDEQLSPQSRDSIQDVWTASQEGAALTRQLLAFSRGAEVPSEDVDLNDAVREFEPILRTLVGPRVRLRFTASPDPVVVRASPTQIQQILANLSINGAHAMPDGGQLNIRTANGPDGAWLCVTDTGTGMDEETVRHVLEPFFTTKAPGEGTGLGLSVVHGIVTGMGGEISIETAPGEGSTFDLCFPSRSGPATWKPGETGPERLWPLPGVRVLLVDDEPATRETILRVLRRAEADVVSVSDGASALRAYDESSAGFDLCLLDVVMPGLSGPALASLLRKRGHDRGLIFMSGNVPAADRRAVEDVGDVFLRKPISPGVLTKTIRNLVPMGEPLEEAMDSGAVRPRP